MRNRRVTVVTWTVFRAIGRCSRFQDVVNSGEDFAEIKRLIEDRADPEPAGGVVRLGVAEGRDQDDRRKMRALLRTFDNAQSENTRHANVGNHQMELFRVRPRDVRIDVTSQMREQFGAVTALRDSVASPAQVQCQDAAHLRIVFR